MLKQMIWACAAEGFDHGGQGRAETGVDAEE